MNYMIVLILLIASTALPGNARDNKETEIVNSYKLDISNHMDHVLTRSLTAELIRQGDSTKLRIGAWNGECGISLGLDDRSRVFLRDDGNLEWEIELNEPVVGALSYPVDAERLTCYYQPSLTEEESATGFYRPDSVVGSYAFYHAGGRGDRIVFNGRDSTVYRYGSGKAFHIYAPYAWDSDYDTIKCSLHIDIPNKLLEIHFPEEYMEAASYPVTVDPQFGKSDIGASQLLLSANYSAATLFSAPEDGTLDSIVIYVDEDGTPGTVGGALYGDNGGCDNLIDTTTETVVTGSDGWYQIAVAGNGSFSGGGEYWLAALCGGSPFNLRYDSQTGAETIRDHNDPWPPPDPCNSPTWTHPDLIVSIYAVYTGGIQDDGIYSRKRKLLLYGEGIHE